MKEQLLITIGSVQYRNPIFVASTPATDNLNKICKAVDAGAGGVVVKTAMRNKDGLSDEEPQNFSFATLSKNREVWFNTGTTSDEMDIGKLIVIMNNIFDRYYRDNNLNLNANFLLIPSIATKNIEASGIINMRDMTDLAKPIFNFVAEKNISLNIEINMRYLIRSIEKHFSNGEFRKVVDEYFSINDKNVTLKIEQNTNYLINEFIQLNNEYSTKIGLILKYPFRTDLPYLCYKAAKYNNIISGITVINTIRSPARMQWGLKHKTKYFQISGSPLSELARYSLSQLSMILEVPLISSGGVAMELQEMEKNVYSLAERSIILKNFLFISDLYAKDKGISYIDDLLNKANVSLPNQKQLLDAIIQIKKNSEEYLDLDSFFHKINLRNRSFFIDKKTKSNRNKQKYTTFLESLKKYIKYNENKNLTLKGILAAEDILDRIYIGATAVQLGSAILAHPGYLGLNRIVDFFHAYFESEFFQELAYQDRLKNLDTSAKKNLVEQIKIICSVNNYIGLYKKELHSSKIEIQKPVYEIDPSLCIGCEQCLEVPYCNDSISKRDNVYVIESTCKSCGICKQTCPQNAIYTK